ncbi:MAG: hypothetical protein H5U39_07830 [Deferribacterales bacterium]|nr:hypothetical protein [Deferribacterales bacterium]
MSDKNEKQKLRDIIVSENAGEEDLTYIISLMKKYDIKTVSEKYVDDYVNKSKELLNIFPKNEYRDALEFLAEYVIKRDR